MAGGVGGCGGCGRVARFDTVLGESIVEAPCRLQSVRKVLQKVERRS